MARIRRHKRMEKTLHWHIDYLLKEATIFDVRVYPEGCLTECGLNKRVFEIKGAQLSTPGFGSSDCKCKSHLAYFRELPGIESLAALSSRSS